MVKKTKKEYKPSAKIKASIKSILEFNTKAMKAENLATERNTDFIVKFYDVLKSVKGAERKYILNTVLDSLDKSKAKWIKALINKLLKDDGELNQWLIDNPNKKANDFIRNRKLGEKEKAQQFQTRKRNANPKKSKKLDLSPVPEVEAVRTEVINLVANKLDYLDQEKLKPFIDKLFEAATLEHHQDSANTVLKSMGIIDKNVKLHKKSA